MEPLKWSALALCLQKSQADIVDAVEAMNWQTERAEKAEAEVTKLRSVIEASGSDNMRQIVELLTELRVARENLEVEREQHNQLRIDTRALCDEYDKLLEKHNGLRDSLPRMLETAKLLDAQRDMFRDYWIDEKQRRINAERSDRRNKQYLARARKSRNKAQRRLYTLRKKVLKLQAANN